MKKLHIEKMILGPVHTNCYFAINQETKEALIVDPADQMPKIKQRISQLGITPVAVLLTHGHFDHIYAAEDVRKAYGVQIYAQECEQTILENPQYNLSTSFTAPLTLQADCLVKEGQQLELAGFVIKVIHTPGHTKGGACYYFEEEKALFSGDTLFCQSVGRSDFPTGSMSTLVHSVRRLVEELPEDTNVYPGHEEETDIGYEKQHNPFL